MPWGFRKYMVWILQNVIQWRNGQVGWVLGGFGGSDGSLWVMGEWSVGQWIVGVISFQKIFGLYGLKHHIVEMSPMRDGTNKQTTSEDRATQLLIWETLSLAIKNWTLWSWNSAKGCRELMSELTSLDVLMLFTMFCNKLNNKIVHSPGLEETFVCNSATIVPIGNFSKIRNGKGCPWTFITK